MGKPIKHVMLDLETLAVSSDAAVIQAGIVWDHSDGATMALQYNCSPVQYRDHLAHFHVDQNTINFHQRKNPENFKLCIESVDTIHDFAKGIRAAIEEAKEGGKYAIWLWCCGTDFDIPILSNLFKYAVLKPNWSYSNVRDYRTLRELYKEQVPKGYKNDHCAVRDAVNQYKHLMQILDYMELEKSGGFGTK